MTPVELVHWAEFGKANQVITVFAPSCPGQTHSLCFLWPQETISRRFTREDENLEPAGKDAGKVFGQGLAEGGHGFCIRIGAGSSDHRAVTIAFSTQRILIVFPFIFLLLLLLFLF